MAGQSGGADALVTVDGGADYPVAGGRGAAPGELPFGWELDRLPARRETLTLGVLMQQALIATA